VSVHHDIPFLSKYRPLANSCLSYGDSPIVGIVPLQLPLSAADFMDVQLRELARLNYQLNLLSQRFNPLIEACVTGTVPVNVLTAVYLVRRRGDVHKLTVMQSK
jgi:hypothetical protein